MSIRLNLGTRRANLDLNQKYSTPRHLDSIIKLCGLCSGSKVCNGERNVCVH